MISVNNLCTDLIRQRPVKLALEIAVSWSFVTRSRVGKVFLVGFSVQGVWACNFSLTVSVRVWYGASA